MVCFLFRVAIALWPVLLPGFTINLETQQPQQLFELPVVHIALIADFLYFQLFFDILEITRHRNAVALEAIGKFPIPYESRKV